MGHGTGRPPLRRVSVPTPPSISLDPVSFPIHWHILRSRYNWEAVIREWSLRWGDLVDGWWFDGCYAPIEMYTYETAPNFGTWAAAARAGNNASILTFSYGEMAYGQSVTVESDYVDGDSRTEVLSINPSVPEHQGYSQWNEQQHLVTFFCWHWLGFLTPI